MGKYCDADNGRPPGPPPPQTAFKRGPPEKKARADEKVLGGWEWNSEYWIHICPQIGSSKEDLTSGGKTSIAKKVLKAIKKQLQQQRQALQVVFITRCLGTVFIIFQFSNFTFLLNFIWLTQHRVWGRRGRKWRIGIQTQSNGRQGKLSLSDQTFQQHQWYLIPPNERLLIPVKVLPHYPPLASSVIIGHYEYCKFCRTPSGPVLPSPPWLHHGLPLERVGLALPHHPPLLVFWPVTTPTVVTRPSKDIGLTPPPPQMWGPVSHLRHATPACGSLKRSNTNNSAQYKMLKHLWTPCT